MKRYGLVIALMALVLTACGAPETDTPPEEKTNTEQESTQSEAQAQAQAQDSEAESVQTEESDADKAEVEIKQADLHDEVALGDFFYEYYLEVADKDVQQDQAFVTSNLVFQYADFNDDGDMDVVCYAESPSYAFSEFLFVTIENGAYQAIETSISPVFAYEQSFGKEGEFVVHKVTGGGTGISETFLELCHMADGKIEYTGTSIVLDGYVSIPPTESNPEGVSITHSSELFDMSYKVGSDLDKWLLFQYNYTETDDVSGEILYEKEEQYTYNADSNSYYVDLLSEMAKSGTKGTAEQTEAGVYLIKHIEPGQVLEGFDVEEAYYVDQDRAGFKLLGSAEIEGTIMVDEMTDEYVFSASEPLLSSPIRISVEGLDFDFDRPAGAYFDVAVLGTLKEVERQYLKDQGTLSVRLVIDSYACAVKFASEGGQAIDITNIESIEDIDAHYGDSEYYEGLETNKLQGFESETFTTNKQGDLALDYANYRLVILPMFETVNAEKLGSASAVFEGDYINPLKFTVMGRLEDVKINNYSTFGEEGAWVYLGDVENAIVTVDANLPSDMSGVKVYGKFYDGEGTYIDVEFALDDMRSVSEYEILTFE